MDLDVAPVLDDEETAALAKGVLADHAKPSKQTMRERILYHYQGNAEGSTLRLSPSGCAIII